MVSTSYPSDLNDWRGLFIRHLVRALARRDDVILRLWSPPGEVPDNAEYIALPDEARWLARLMADGGIAHKLRTGGIGRIGTPIRLLRMLRHLYKRETTIGLYHINWLQNTLALPRNEVPLLVTVLGTDMQLLKLPGMTQLLRWAFRRHRVTICPNAEWMVPKLEQRFGDIARIQFVPFGIEPRWYALQRSESANEKKQWLCVSRLTRGKIGYLFDWAQPYFANATRELHLFGPMQQTMVVPDWVHYHGPATPETLCRDWFPVAQGLITLSQHAEGRPQVMLEAMASGLPIIASRLPAHEDLLRHRDTGWICSQRDDLHEALTMLEDGPENHEMGQRAREWVKTEIGTWDDCASRYTALYADLTQEGRQ